MAKPPVRLPLPPLPPHHYWEVSEYEGRYRVHLMHRRTLWAMLKIKVQSVLADGIPLFAPAIPRSVSLASARAENGTPGALNDAALTAQLTLATEREAAAFEAYERAEATRYVGAHWPDTIDTKAGAR